MIISWRRLKSFVTAGILFSFVLPGCSSMGGRTELPPPPAMTEEPTTPPPAPPQAQEEPTRPAQKVQEVGKASWYGSGHQGKETANGESFNQQELTAASPTLPLGTKATVTNLETGKSVQVTINDRGPYVKGRKIDLSRAAAQQIGVNKKGVAKVKIAAAVSRRAKKRVAHKQTKGSPQEDGKTTQSQTVSPE